MEPQPGFCEEHRPLPQSLREGGVTRPAWLGKGTRQTHGAGSIRSSEPACQLLGPAFGLRSPFLCVEFPREGALHCASLRLRLGVAHSVNQHPKA